MKADQPFNLSISVSEHKTGPSFTATTDGNRFIGLRINLSPDEARLIIMALVAEYAPVAEWRNHPVYQWAKRKTGEA